MRKLKLHWQILISLTTAVLLAVFLKSTGLDTSVLGRFVAQVCEFLGKIFMNGLKMVVIPLMVSSIVCGVMSLGGNKNFGRLALKTVGFYVLTTFLAILVGLLVVNVVRPGHVDIQTAQNIIGQAYTSSDNTANVMQIAKQYKTQDIFQIFLQMVPPNIVAAATDETQLLGLIVFGLVFGFFITKLPQNLREWQESFWQSLHKIMMRITDCILKAAPYGIFGLVTPVVMRTGFALFKPMLWFLLTVILALSIFMFVVLGLMLRYIGRVQPWAHMRAMLPVLLTGFSTASSASTMPIALESVEFDSKVSNKMASFIIPLGVTINMAGTALYECTVVLFLGQIYGVLQGVEFTWMDQFMVVVMALLTSFGVAAVPAASLVAITVILGAVGLPVEAVGVVWVADRLLDMCRTAVNVFTNTCGAVIIARTEGERTAYPIEKS